MASGKAGSIFSARMVWVQRSPKSKTNVNFAPARCTSAPNDGIVFSSSVGCGADFHESNNWRVEQGKGMKDRYDSWNACRSAQRYQPVSTSLFPHHIAMLRWSCRRFICWIASCLHFPGRPRLIQRFPEPRTEPARWIQSRSGLRCACLPNPREDIRLPPSRKITRSGDF